MSDKVGLNIDEGVGLFDLGPAGKNFNKTSDTRIANYLNAIKEDNSSLSLNYYVRYSRKRNVQILGEGYDALTSYGYKSYHNETYFGVDCGNYYLDSF